jgi:23S rRNA (adenine2503-C2)-methyltransferase
LGCAESAKFQRGAATAHAPLGFTCSGLLATPRPVVEIVEEHRTANLRYVIALADQTSVESVLYRGDSLCVSSQVGCAVGCPFCASGANGLARNLELPELIGQVERVEAKLGRSVARVTVSGVGEPLHNPAVVEFIDWCRARETPASITTSGGPLRRLQTWLGPEAPPHNGISISIHAGRESTRARTVPRGPALEPLFELLRERVPQLSSSRRRKLALAYLLLAELNDDDAEIDAFLERALPLGLKVHLYRYNPVPTSTQRQVSDQRYLEVYERMCAQGLDVRRSSRARIEENGGCGTLVALRGKQHPGLLSRRSCEA